MESAKHILSRKFVKVILWFFCIWSLQMQHFCSLYSYGEK